MNRRIWAVAVIGPLAAVGWAAWPVAPTPGVSGTPAVASAQAAQPAVNGRAVGVGGCAAVGCHGGPAASLRGEPDRNAWTGSATHWLVRDPHTRAYAVLEGELANRIMLRLTGENLTEPGKPVTAATRDVRCLACHTNPVLAVVPGPDDVRLEALQREGVSCEACHGNASGWLYDHTTWTTGRRVAAYHDAKMTELFDVGTRALVCAGCHVGAPADFPLSGSPVRDMNHDMIAAGHPRLNFDFAAYQHSLPPHWHERDRTAEGSPSRGPDFEAKAWLVGRVAHAEAACRLLESRARRQPGDAPWPEFGESSCVSCHHTIGIGFPPPRGTRRPGVPVWQPVWPVTRPGDLGAFGRLAPVDPAAAAVRDLLDAIEQTRPSPGAVLPASDRAAAALADLRVKLLAAPDSTVRAAVAAALKAALDDGGPPPDLDTAGQWFHAITALERARIGAGGKFDAEAFDRVRCRLTLPRGTLRFDAPADIRTDLKALVK